MTSSYNIEARRRSSVRQWTRTVRLDEETSNKLAEASAYFDNHNPDEAGMPTELSHAMNKLLIRRRSQATVNPFVRRRPSYMRLEDISRGKKFKNAALLALEISRLNQAKQRLGLPSLRDAQANGDIGEEGEPLSDSGEGDEDSDAATRKTDQRKRLRNFRVASRAILIVIRACNAVRDLLSNRVKGERWMLVMDNILLNASRSRGRRQVFVARYADENSRDLVEVSFDANKYRRDFASEELLAGKTRAALERTPSSRSTDQVRDIVRCMRTLSIDFRHYPIEVQWRICEVAFFDKFAANRVIIKQGLPPDGFYFVLMGTVAEHSPDKRMPKDHNVGSKFGEQDLVCGSHRRTTAVARTYVELLYIHRLDYGRIFSLGGTPADSSDLNICRTNPVFSQFPLERFVENPGTWNVVPYKVGQLIAEDSNRVDWIYIVKHGQARIIRAMETRYIEMNRMNNEEDLQNLTHKLLDFTSQSLGKCVPKTARVCTAKSSRSCPPILGDLAKDKDEERVVTTKRQTSGRFPVTSTRPKTSVPLKNTSLVPVPAFLQLEQLGPGQAFGLRACLDEEERGPTVSLVSAGCTMLLINRRYFTSHLDTFMLGMIRLYTKPYPTENDLLRNLSGILKWEDYKGNTLKSSISQIYARKQSEKVT